LERYEFSDGKSDKFWEVAVTGSTLSVRFGRIGTQGQTKDKDFASHEAAEKEKTKLVKEKTGKGYLACGNASPAAATPAASPAKKVAAASRSAPATQAEAAPAAPVAAVEVIKNPVVSQPALRTPPATPDARLLDAAPLPTRSRPGPALPAAETAWAAFVAEIRRYVEKPRTDAQFKHKSKLEAMLAGPPEKLPLEQAAAWFGVLDDVIAKQMGYRGQEAEHAAYFSVVQNFATWLLAAQGALYLVQLVPALSTQFSARRTHYRDNVWADAAWPALRQALVQAPEADYQAALEWSLATLACQGDLKHGATWCFMLADDRPGQHHALQPGNILRRAAEAGPDVLREQAFFPLLAETGASLDPRWLSKQNYYFYFAYSFVAPGCAAATVLATAANQGISPIPTLDWLLFYASDEARTTIAGAMIDSQENDALALLLPLSFDKWIRRALDQALEVHPRFMARQLLALFNAGRSDPTVRVRLLKLVQEYGSETLGDWVADLGERAVAQLDALLASAARLATPEELPEFLRQPPWHKARRKTSDDLVLTLLPEATPFTCSLSDEERQSILQQATTRRGNWAEQLGKVGGVVHSIQNSEAELRKKHPHLPEPETPIPQKTESEAAVAAWLVTRIQQLHAASIRIYYNHPYSDLYRALIHLPDTVALRLWEQTQPMRERLYGIEDTGQAMLARFGAAILPGLLPAIESDPLGGLEIARTVGSAAIAPLAARAMFKLKKAKPLAIDWLLAHPRDALVGLLPDAVGKPGAARDAAEFALRWLLAGNPELQAELDAVAALYARQDPQVGAAVAQVMARDPLDQVPAKPPKLPVWFVPGSLSRPQLKSGGALSDEAMNAIAEMLIFSPADEPYAGTVLLREACDAGSLAAFAWDLFSIWLTEGAVGKENWALRALGWLGDDETARRLTPMIRKWPGEAAHARAVQGLDVLAMIGSDVALMHLNGIAEKLKFKGLQEKAREKIAALAEARDLSPEELADRLVPDFDLDERGGLDLEFGPRRFRVGFDEFLKPWVKDENGPRLKDLPKPNKSDDPELSAAAASRWSTLKKDVRTVASLQIARLEGLLATSRRIPPAVFDTFFVRHPLIRNLAQRLVWGVYDDRSPATAPRLLFRITEDLSCADAFDEALDIDFSDSAGHLIGLVHPLQMSGEQREAWGNLFGDYEIAQPFAQLGRDAHALAADELDMLELTRFAGIEVDSKRLRGFATGSWRLGSPQDGGGIWWIQRKVQFADGRQGWALLDFSDGLIVGGMEYEDSLQTLGKLTLDDNDWRWNQKQQHKFAELDPVTASEILRDLGRLADMAKT